MKAYKGFNRDMTCMGFQYPESGEVHVSDIADLCNSGVHACEAPLDCFAYYPPSVSVYREVELSGVSAKKSNDDTKICGTDIQIGAQLNIAGIVKAQIEYVKSHVTNEHNAENGKPATAGEYGAATAGEYGAATAGNRGAATAGEYGAATSRGKTEVGENGVGLARGNSVMIKGGMGALLVIAEENENNYDIKYWCAGVVDGETLKPYTWYRCVEGKFVEVE